MRKTEAATFRERKRASELVPKTVCAAELAALLRDPPFTDRWLRDLADQGYLIKAGRGRYELAQSIRGFVRYVRETEVKASNPDASDSRDLFEAERARKLKLENDRREALLVDTSEAIAAIQSIVGIVAAELESIPSRLTDDVGERRRIEHEIDTIRTGLVVRLEKAQAALLAGDDPLAADDQDAA